MDQPAVTPKPKGKVGRPRKVVVVEEAEAPASASQAASNASTVASAPGQTTAVAKTPTMSDVDFIDPFWLYPVESEAPRGRAVLCPRCGAAVPSAGNFFWIHLAQCDAALFAQHMQGTKHVVPKLAPHVSDASYGPEHGAREEARKRRERVSDLVSELFEGGISLSDLNASLQEESLKRIKMLQALSEPIAALELPKEPEGLEDEFNVRSATTATASSGAVYKAVRVEGVHYEFFPEGSLQNL